MHKYATDVSGVMLNGVVICKEQSRRIFETETNNTVNTDVTSVLENVAGNLFKSKVNNIGAMGTKIIQIGWSESLDLKMDNLYVVLAIINLLFF